MMKVSKDELAAFINRDHLDIKMNTCIDQVGTGLTINMEYL